MSRIPPSRPLRTDMNGGGGGYSGYRDERGSPNNGYQEDYGSNDAYQRSPDRRAPRDRRAGGYGGFDPAPREQPDDRELRVNRPTSLERSRAKRRSPKADEYRERTRGNGSGSRQMEEVLQYISSEWGYMTEDKCVPVQLALKLLDSSSLGLATRYRDFKGTHNELQNALKAIVNEHHQGFNSSIGTFHKIQNSLQFSQQRIRTLKDSLVAAKSHLAATKPELQGFATSSQNYDDMLQVLATIEDLQLIPEKLEARISEKRFLVAVDILQDALTIIRRSDMENIGALSDLRLYLSNQEHSLTDILIEELHSHVYLKSPYCEDRWKLYAQNQTASGMNGQSVMASRGRALYFFLDRLDTSELMVDDATRNPEADTFHYIRLLIESLNKLGRLDTCIDTMEQRMPVELFKVVEKSNNEVAQRHPSTLRAYANKGRSKYDFAMDTDDARAALLNDLLWTLFARFEAIAEGHRVVHDIIGGIVKRERLAEDPTLVRGFKELWKLYQSEIRSLLHDYLATDGDDTYRLGQKASSSGNVFAKIKRDKNKRMFKLNDMDLKSTELAAEKDDLEFILKSSVPGLVSASRQPDGTTSTDSAVVHDGSATGHRLLVEPSVFNMGILLPPSLDFLGRLKEIVPPSSDIVLSTLTSFLDDFLINVFHPQLDETLVELCAQTFIEVDAFQQDSDWATMSQKPIFKGTSRFFNLIIAFCKMLDNLPHDQSISQLIITQMITYYDKCFGWYKALVSRSQPKATTGTRLKKSAAFVEMDVFTPILKTLLQTPVDDVEAVLSQETEQLLRLCSEDPLELADLVMERKSVAALCTLYTSMKWLASKVGNLRYISERATNSSRSKSGRQKAHRWTMVANDETRLENSSVYLPLDMETATSFDGVVASYAELADTVLQTLHFELRCHIIHSITQTMQGTHRLEHIINEPDPEVVSLNADIGGLDEDMSNSLPSAQHQVTTRGLGILIDTLIVRLAPNLSPINGPGLSRIQLTILVLQQNLKNIEPDSDLRRSALYFDYFSKGPEAIVALARETGGKGLEFGYDELKVLIELCYSEKLTHGQRGEEVAAKRALDDHLLQLSEHLWSS